MSDESDKERQLLADIEAGLTVNRMGRDDALIAQLKEAGISEADLESVARRIIERRGKRTIVYGGSVRGTMRMGALIHPGCSEMLKDLSRYVYAEQWREGGIIVDEITPLMGDNLKRALLSAPVIELPKMPSFTSFGSRKERREGERAAKRARKKERR